MLALHFTSSYLMSADKRMGVGGPVVSNFSSLQSAARFWQATQSHQFLLDVRTEMKAREYLLFPKMKKKKKPLDENDSLRSTMDRINNNTTNQFRSNSITWIYPEMIDQNHWSFQPEGAESDWGWAKMIFEGMNISKMISYLSALSCEDQISQHILLSHDNLNLAPIVDQFVQKWWDVQIHLIDMQSCYLVSKVWNGILAHVTTRSKC
jgi:hypothetical protein